MPIDATLAAFSQGFVMMAGLIVAIGAQNALVLRQGLARAHVLPVVAFCTVSDWLLTAAGVFGLGALIARSPTALELMRYGGAAFLAWYGARSALRAWRGDAQGLSGAGRGNGLRPTLAAAAAMTYLNPHVYLDTVVLVGLVGAQHAAAPRVGFVLGAAVASGLWFSVLGFGAAWAARWLQRPIVWRCIDAAVAIVMWTVAAQLLRNPLQSAA
jgi:L-lysine exporter family protein LysE/ArgO